MTKPPLVQLALDFPTIDEALRAAEVGVRAGVDILEAGTPLIISEGVGAVGKLASAFPDMQILADYKTMDSGFRNVVHTKDQGAHYMTVCANAPDETVQSAIRQGKEIGIQIVVDTIGVKSQADRARQCAQWGADMVYLHFGADQRRADPTQNSNQWLDEVLETVDVPVGVATFDIPDAVESARRGAQLVAIGHPLVGTDFTALNQLQEYISAVKSSFRQRPA